MKTYLYLLFILSSVTGSYAQEKTDKLPTYFGIQVKSVFPSDFIKGQTTFSQKDGYESSIEQRMGFGFGGTIRASLTKLIAFETGLNFTQRHYSVSAAIPDSNIFVRDSMTFIEYDVPVNALFYIQLSKKFFMNASMGASITFKPTNTAVETEVGGKHHVYLHGVNTKHFGFDLNANLGFEFRTEKSGFFYLGGSARVPFKPLFKYVFEYENGANKNYLFSDVSGSFLTIDFKYFFPLIKNRGTQFKRGPIE